MSFLDDILASDTLTSVRTSIQGYAQAAGLIITSWTVGDVGQQIFEAVSSTVYQYTRVVSRVTRGFISLDTATDPGDPDTFDPANEDLDPAPGFLSYLGENTYGTVRTGETFASGVVTFLNTGTGAITRTFGPGALSFRRSTGSPPPTYRNAPDASIYTNPDGTVTVASGAQLDIPVVADVIGADSDAGPGTLSLVTSLVGASATNASAITATSRETAAAYRAKCRQAPARLSFGAPADAIAYLASKTLDGQPLTNENGDTVAITRAYVSNDSATGIVNAYFATPAGGTAVSDDDLDAATANIETNAYAVMDCVTFNEYKATDVTVTVVGTGRLLNGGATAIAAAKTAIVEALQDYFESFPIGGLDQTAGAGFLYTDDIEAIAATAYPGLYNVQVTTPAGASTALAEGHVAVLSTAVGSWTIT